MRRSSDPCISSGATPKNSIPSGSRWNSAFIDRLKEVRFLRFCTVGVANTAIDFAVFFIVTLFGVAHLQSQVISYTAGVVSSYLLNRTWTFQVTRKASALEALRFVMLNILSLVVSIGLLYVLRDLNQLGLLYSKVLTTAGAVAVNYVGSCWWVFAEKQKARVMLSET